MEKMNMQTNDLAAEKFEQLKALFPEAITETLDENGNLVRGIDADQLRQAISQTVIEGNKERYQMTWSGKKEAIRLANEPTNKTMRPCREESVDFDATENLYIEGDNLDALKLLRETYLGKVKMIYIDPPYNTGNDFIYNDSFLMEKNEYALKSGIKDEEGNRLFDTNKDTNGRFHSDWLSMIYPRLKLAKDLLRDDGVIFISIDDKEIENLKKVCNEIFGEQNFVAQMNWKGRGGRQDSKYYAVIHEFILCYAKHIDNFEAGEEIISGSDYPKFDSKRQRYYKTQLLRKWGSNSRKEDRPNLFYPIKAPDGTDVYPMKSESICGCWRWKKEKMDQSLKEELIEFINNGGTWTPYEKIYAPTENETKKYVTWIDNIGNGTKELKQIFDSKIVFDYSKSSDLIMLFLKMTNLESNDIVLDFFSGSATTAHAVMQLNAERILANANSADDKLGGGGRMSGIKFIMIQLPEPCTETSEAYQAGYQNICEIGKERIRRAGAKIKEKNPLLTNQLDTGFRVLKIDSSNMEDVFYRPHELKQNELIEQANNIKADRTDEDLLFQIMLDLGIELSSSIERIEKDNYTFYNVADHHLIACFDSNITDEIVTEIANYHPNYVVFGDSGFAKDSTAINFEQIFKSLSPNTECRTL